MPAHFTLRELAPTDGPAIEKLGEQTPETAVAAFHSRFHHDPYASLLAQQPSTIGVVAETPGHVGLVGLGLVRFGQCMYEASLRPFAYMYSLSVHPDYRRQGLASQIAASRIETARQRVGDDGVIVAGIQPGNAGSLRTAQKWYSQRLDRTSAGVARVRTKPPRPRSDWVVRPADDSELEEIAEKQNAFYRDYNLYTPQTAHSLAAWRAEIPLGFALHDYYLLADSRRNILAGLGITDEGRVMSSQLVHMALPLRLANMFLRIVPSDGVMKRMPVEHFWFAPGHAEAAAFLWESMRWLWRDRGTMLMAFYDTQGPLTRVISLPKFIPSQTGSLVVSGPVPMREDRLIYQPH
jgi:ribosomal protein S18 acetylase RimI-like enzyme